LQRLFDSLPKGAQEKFVKPIEDAHEYFGAYVNDLASALEILSSCLEVFREMASKKDSFSSDPYILYIRQNHERIVSGDLKFNVSGKLYTYQELLSIVNS
jgi:hypothetical protein